MSLINLSVAVLATYKRLDSLFSTLSCLSNMNSAPLPYYAQAETLPRELPTKAEIESSQDVLCEQSARKVVGVGAHFIVKYGLQIDLAEGQNMLMIKKTTSVSVPYIYALFKDHVSNQNYIIMERIAGVTLDRVWASLNQTQKEAVSAKIKASLDELRKIPSPGEYCSLDKRPLLDSIFWTGDSAESLGLEGPFETEAGLNNALIRKYLSSNGLPEGKAEFYKRAFPSVLCEHPPVFTHGDLQRKNIMVLLYSIDRIEEAKDIVRVTFIGWEISGWYPSYWEYARAMFACGHFTDDWSYWVDKILDRYLNEWAWMQMIILELWS